MINTLIIDDEKLCIEYLSQLLINYSNINIVSKVTNIDSLFKVLSKNKIDLIFMDIEIGSDSGFHASDKIKNIYPDIMIVFVTGYADFALEGYEYSPIDFIVKPVENAKLHKVIFKVEKRYNEIYERKNKIIKIKNCSQIDVVKINDIIYIEKSGKKTIIYCSKNKCYESSDTLKTLYKLLFSNGFYKPHQSFLVALDKIKSIKVDKEIMGHAYYIQLEGVKKRIPLSRSYHTKLRKIIMK